MVSVLGDVLYALDKSKKFVVTDETIETTAGRMNELIGTLGYDIHRVNFERGSLERCIMMGDKDAIHNVLHYLLINFEDLKKKAYLAEFLNPVDVPMEYLSDHSLAESYQQLEELQSQFRRAHRMWEERQSASHDLAELKDRLRQDEDDKDRLIQQIQEKENQTAGIPGFAEIFRVTSLLRKEQEKEAELSERLRQCHDELGENAKRCMNVRERRDHMRRQLDNANGQAEVMFSILRNEIARSRESVERLESQIEEYKEHMNDHEEIIKSPAISSKNLEEIETRLKDTRDECEKLDKTIRSKDQIAPSLKMHFNHLNDRETHLRELEAEVQEYEQRNNHALREMSMLEKGFEAKFGRRFLPENEYELFKRDLQEMRDKHNELKQRVEALNSELATLQRTEQILTNQNQQLTRETQRLEELRGVSGYEVHERKLESISIMKNNSDKSKEDTLQDLSTVVIELDQQLRSKAQMLQPFTEKIKNLKKQIADLEKQVDEKKSLRDAENKKFEQKLRPLREQVSALQTTQSMMESQVFANQINKTISEVTKQRIESEKRCLLGSSRFAPSTPTLQAALEQKITDLERDSTALRSQYSVIQQQGSRLVSQKKNLEGVRALLESKLSVLSSTGNVLGTNRDDNDGLNSQFMMAQQMTKMGGGMTNSLNTSAMNNRQNRVDRLIVEQ